MELSSLVFALGLFSAGVWLIFMISGDFKAKKRQVQQIPPGPRRGAQQPARRASIAGAQRSSTAVSTRQPSTPRHVEAVGNSLAAVEKAGAVDPLQGLSVAFVRETFERFTREL
jgi:hypothetical protein